MRYAYRNGTVYRTGVLHTSTQSDYNESFHATCNSQYVQNVREM